MTKDPLHISLAVHELQAPLTLLHALLEKALGTECGRSDCRELLRECLDEVRGMNQFVVDLLLLQKANSTPHALDPKLVDVMRLIHTVAQPDISLTVIELQAPLTLLRGRLEKALATECGRIDCRELLRECLDEVRGMIQLVVDLLILENAGSGERALDRKRVDVTRLIIIVAQRFQPLADKSGIRLETEVESDLTVVGEEDGLRRVLLNLLENAFRYTPPGGRISIEGRRVKGRLEMRVRDTGCGIPPEAVPRVFERFYQVDKSRDEEAGVGLGLAIVRALVEQAGGTIEVGSTPGKGTHFKLSFPLAPDDG